MLEAPNSHCFPGFVGDGHQLNRRVHQLNRRVINSIGGFYIPITRIPYFSRLDESHLPHQELIDPEKHMIKGKK